MERPPAKYVGVGGAGEIDTSTCWVGFTKESCLQNTFEPVAGAAGAAICRGRGFTVAKGSTARPMSQTEINQAFEKGEAVVFYRPSKFDPR